MRVQRRLASSLTLSLLLGSALAWPVYGQTPPAGRKGAVLRGANHLAAGLRIAPPDLPGDLNIDASELQPGERARSTLSRLVADPGRILQAYAPVNRAKASVPDQHRPTITVRPATLAPLEPEKASSDAPPAAAAVTVASVPASAPALPAPVESPPKAAASPVAAAIVPTVVSPPVSVSTPGAAVLPAPSDVPPPTAAPVAAANPEPATAPVPVATSAPPPVVPAPSAASTTPVGTLDAAALQRAVETYVGAEPTPVAGRIQPQDLARYKDRQAIRTVYAARDFAPFWIEDGHFNARGRSILARIDHASEDGLDLRPIAVAAPKDGDAAALASAEIALTDAAAAYGYQATGGRVDPSRIGPLVAMKPDVADPPRVIAALVDAPDAGEALRAFNPPQRGYAALRDKLGELRRTSDVASRTAVPYGPTLKPGMRDVRVPLIRARFGLDPVPADAADAGLTYDIEVAAAVADFQKAHRLPASGVLTIRTVAAMSGGSPRQLEDEIVANMERWRWLPRDMGENRIEVNIPDFTVNVMHGDAVFHQARVVVGQPDKPTPLFSETMQFIIVNPYWNVPLSIVKNEMLPKLAADPDYFSRHGYETVERGGQTYVRQPPGDSNALGRIKFMFPNKYSVYLHDTNSRSLFGNDRRALSHGCVRVDAPFKFAEAVLGKDNGWTEARVKRLIGGSERTINLPQPLPIHIMYFTAFVDDAGALQLREDVYGYSAKLRAALGLGAASHSGQVATN